MFRLDAIATEHLLSLSTARPAARRRAPREVVPPGILQLLDAINLPAFVESRMFDVLAANRLAGAVSPNLRPGVNRLRTIFLDPAEQALYPDWEKTAGGLVAGFRASVGGDVDDPRIVQLVGELSLGSDKFRRLWARHDVTALAGGRWRCAIRSSADSNWAARNCRSPTRVGRSWRSITPSRGRSRRAHWNRSGRRSTPPRTTRRRRARVSADGTKGAAASRRTACAHCTGHGAARAPRLGRRGEFCDGPGAPALPGVLVIRCYGGFELRPPHRGPAQFFRRTAARSRRRAGEADALHRS